MMIVALAAECDVYWPWNGENMAVEDNGFPKMEDDPADLLRNNAFDDDWNIPSLSFPKIDEDTFGLSNAVVPPQNDSETEKTTVVPAQSDAGKEKTTVVPVRSDSKAEKTTVVPLRSDSDIEETAVVPAGSLTFDGAAEPSHSAVPVSGGIDDLEKLAEDDPEHDPLKTVPVPPKKPLPTKKIVLAVIVAVVVIALIVAGVLATRSKDKAQSKRDAIALCEKAQSKYSKASKALEDAMQKASGLQKLTEDQVSDGNALTKLNKSVEQGEQLASSNITTECSASLAQTVLESRASNMNKHIGEMQKRADAVASAVKTV